MLKELFALIKWLFSQLITKLVLITFFAAFVTLYYQYRKERRDADPQIIKAVITLRYDKSQTAYFQYEFIVSGKKYTNSALRSLCHDCKNISCVVGDSVLIKYRKDNPSNNEPVCNK